MAVWFCGLKKKWLVWPPRQNWLSHLKCKWRCLYSWRVSNVSLAQDWLGQTVTHSCCNDIQQCSISFMYPSLYSHFLIDSSVYWLAWLGILASHAPWLAPESVFALSLPSGGEYYAELWLLAARQPAEFGLLLHSYSPPSPLSLLVYFESFLAILPFLRDYSFPCGSSCYLPVSSGKMHQVFFLMKMVSESPWIVVLLKIFSLLYSKAAGTKHSLALRKWSMASLGQLNWRTCNKDSQNSP